MNRFYEEDTELDDNALPDNIESLVHNEVNKVINGMDRENVSSEVKSSSNENHKSDYITNSINKNINNNPELKSATSKIPKSSTKSHSDYSVFKIDYNYQRDKERRHRLDFLGLYSRLQPINVKPNAIDNFISFESKSVSEQLLSQVSNEACLFSACIGSFDPYTNMLRTLNFQASLVNQDFLYIPIYVVDRKIIKDIVFLVFNYGMKPKRASDFRFFIETASDNLAVINYAILREGQFHMIHNGSDFLLKNNTYYQIIFKYSASRGMAISDSSILCINPLCSTKEETEKRKRLNEVFLEKSYSPN